MPEEKRDKPGQPPIPFEDVFQSNWRERLFAYADEGYSNAEIRKEMAVPIRLWYNYLDEDHVSYSEEFCEAIKQADDLRLAWWEGKGRVNLDNKEFNSTLFMMNMVNRFGWRRDANNQNKELLDMARLVTELAKGREAALNNTLGV